MEVAPLCPDPRVMTKTAFRLLATGSLYLVAAVLANAEDRKIANQHSLTVQLLNLAGVKATELKKAIAEASWIFNKAGVNLNWVHCGSEGSDPKEEAACPDSEDPLVFSLGLVTKAPDFLRDTGMGFALVYSGKRNHAGVLYPRVAALARSHSSIVGTDQVLAYTMVHEIAHLILGSTAHGATGIMRANCGTGELKAVSQRRLLFGSGEIRALHRKLVERRGGLEIAGATRIPSPLP